MSFRKRMGLSVVSLVVLRAAPAQILELRPYQLSPVYSNAFQSAQTVASEEDLIEGGRRVRKPASDAEWIAEGRGASEVRDGWLHVTPKGSHMVVWNRHVFPADFLLEFQMRPNGSSRGLTIVFFCATGAHGEDLFDLPLPPRRGEYVAYHSGAIANYSDSYWSRNTVVESLTNRLRRNPGFQLVAEAPSRTTGSTELTHRIRILKFGGHIEVEIDGTLLFQWDDPGKPLGAGRIGLRTMEGVTSVSYRGFNVWQLKDAQAPRPAKRSRSRNRSSAKP